ncbi:MAG TPA: translational GTPase TypA, partial [Sorangium sp.]|nr:translational GTPase TypA [Sorangium sp.]
QTRFVLQKAVDLGMPIIVVINKIDRHDARADEVVTEVFDLFCSLEASDEQTDFPCLFAIGKDGVAKYELEDDNVDLRPLFDTVLAKVPPPVVDIDAPFRLLVTNVMHDEYVGRLAIGRIERGRVLRNEQLARLAADHTKVHKVTRLYGFQALERIEVEQVGAGDIVAIAGMDAVEIGDTLTHPEHRHALPRIAVEEPTIQVRFMVNTSPLAGIAGKWVTSRHLRERLMREARRNLAMRVEETDSPDVFLVFGRGELMLAVLAETMRREGYEMALGMPEVVLKEIDGKLHEPIERVIVDVPEEYVGTVTSSLGQRRGQLDQMHHLGHGRVRLEVKIPARGLIGYRGQFLTETRGAGLLNTVLDGWMPHAGVMLRRPNGAIVSDRAGKTTPYALFNMQPRGTLCVGVGEALYEGMIVGEHSRPNDLIVNATREKKLTNIRAAGRDENVVLSPPKQLTIESCLEWIDRDELVEVTPAALRLRKAVLKGNVRPRRDGTGKRRLPGS